MRKKQKKENKNKKNKKEEKRKIKRKEKEKKERERKEKGHILPPPAHKLQEDGKSSLYSDGSCSTDSYS